MRDILKRKSFVLILTLIGAAAGYFYWKYVGCLSGTCPIQSVWYWSTLWGAAVGYLSGDMINDFVLKRKTKAEEKE